MTPRLKALLVSIALSLASPLTAQTVSMTNPYLRMCDGVQRPIAADSVKNYRPARTASGVLCWVLRDSVMVPVDTVKPPVIPVGSGEPVFGPGDVVVLSDNMDRYTSVAAAQSATGPGFTPGEDPRNELAVTAGRSGQALRVAYLGGSQTGAEWHTKGTGRQPDTVTHVIQYYARATFSAPLTSTLGVKWLMGFHNSGNDRIQWHMHWNPPQTGCIYSRSGLPPWTRWQVMDKSVFTNCQAMQPVGPYIEQVADGQWHRFTHEYKPQSAAGRRDGIARMWVDGVKILDVSAAACGGVPVVPPGALYGKPWCALDDLDKLAVRDGILFLKLGGAQTTSTPRWTMDIDDLMWVRR